jgi:hypothetical protein
LETDKHRMWSSRILCQRNCRELYFGGYVI